MFGRNPGNSSADPYLGVTWLTFRERKHSLSKWVLKTRPAGFDSSGKFLGIISLGCFFSTILFLCISATLTSPEIESYKSRYLSTEVRTSYR